MPKEYPNLVITFLIEYDGSYLLIKRLPEEANFPNLWAFPGGKVEVGETVVDTIQREIQEETSLDINGEFKLLDAYCFGRSTGLAFLVRAKHDQVVPNGFVEYKWIKTKAEMESLQRIPGIDNHLMIAIRKFQHGEWQRFEEIQLTENRYLNR